MPRCDGCWTILAYACTHGHDARLCETFLDYHRTGNLSALDQAIRIAPPALMEAAREQAVILGLAAASKKEE